MTDKITLKIGIDNFVTINQIAISYLKSFGDYVEYHMTDGKRHVVYGRLKNQIDLLNKTHFIHIHRSYIVNTFGVKSLLDGYVFVMNDKTIIKTGEKFIPNVKEYYERE